MKAEEWKDIEGYEGLYQISNLGNVKSLRDKNNPIILKPGDVNGYLFVNLSNKGKIKPFRVHRLVAIAFIHNEDNKPMVNHKDGIRSNNILTNLEWCTRSENMKHGFNVLNNIPVSGEKHGKAKLSEKDIFEILKYKGSKIKHEVIAQKYGVNKRTIGLILSGERWKHLI